MTVTELLMTSLLFRICMLSFWTMLRVTCGDTWHQLFKSSPKSNQNDDLYSSCIATFNLRTPDEAYASPSEGNSGRLTEGHLGGSIHSTREEVYEVCSCTVLLIPWEIPFTSFSTYSLLISECRRRRVRSTAEENPCIILLGLPVALLSCFLGELSSRRTVYFSSCSATDSAPQSSRYSPVSDLRKTGS